MGVALRHVPGAFIAKEGAPLRHGGALLDVSRQPEGVVAQPLEVVGGRGHGPAELARRAVQVEEAVAAAGVPHYIARKISAIASFLYGVVRGVFKENSRAYYYYYYYYYPLLRNFKALATCCEGKEIGR